MCIVPSLQQDNTSLVDMSTVLNCSFMCNRHTVLRIQQFQNSISMGTTQNYVGYVVDASSSIPL